MSSEWIEEEESTTYTFISSTNNLSIHVGLKYYEEAHHSNSEDLTPGTTLTRRYYYRCRAAYRGYGIAH